MKISLNWLRRYLEIDWSVEEIAERLTLAGLEVEDIEEIKPAFTQVQVGRVLSTQTHPKADRLRLAEVDLGDRRETVVCGAANCRPGITVAYAGLGAQLAGGLEIKRAHIRGVESCGMLCSEQELGLVESADGILELPMLTLGTPLEEALPIRDTILDLGITPNRGDWLGHLGVARELAALAGLPLKRPEIKLPPQVEGEAIPVQIEAPERCGRYIARVIRGLKVGPSPFWMQQLLRSVGVRPINNLVDVTNFVLFEYGQPLHAFDLNQLKGRSVSVRCAAEGEQICTLDGEKRRLGPEDLLICDGERPIAIAGVMGGENTEVQEESSTILLEAAWFRPSSVRMTARRLGLKSESSHRFERFVDPDCTLEAANRALQLFAELSAPGSRPEMVSAYSDARGALPSSPLIEFHPQDTERLLGVDWSPERQAKALRALGFKLEQAGGSWSVGVPSWRGDMAESADVVEEIARYIGYAEIPTPEPRVSARSSEGGHAQYRRLQGLRRFLQDRGLHQALNYSFLAPDFQAHFSQEPALRLKNPLNEEQGALRRLLVPGLVSNLSHNQRHGEGDVALYELGQTFLPEEEGHREIKSLGILLAGRLDFHWSGSTRTADFFDLKGLIEDLCHSMGHRPSFQRAEECSWLHPGASALVTLAARPLGVMGLLHPGLTRSLNLQGEIYLAELDLSPLIGEAAPLRSFEDFVRLPAAQRDLALKLPRSVEAGQVLSAIEELSLEEIDRVEIFDVYRGGSLEADKKSLGISLIYRGQTQTLTEEELSQAHSQVLKHLVHSLGAALR